MTMYLSTEIFYKDGKILDQKVKFISEKGLYGILYDFRLCKYYAKSNVEYLIRSGHFKNFTKYSFHTTLTFCLEITKVTPDCNILDILKQHQEVINT